MNRILLLLFVLLTFSGPSFAEKISKAQAQKIAQGYLAKSKNQSNKLRLASVPRKWSTKAMGEEQFAPFYVYNNGNNNGFVIVSGNDALGTILAYSHVGTFKIENAPSNLCAMMDLYAKAVEAVEKAANTKLQKRDTQPGTVIVEPLLGDANWGQGFPYNNAMPTYLDDKRKEIPYYVGCVATAMAQIMRYHQYPIQGTGQKTYLSNIGKQLTADFGNTTYDWSNMPAHIDQNNPTPKQIEEVSRLSYQAAVSVSMQFAKNGSGTYNQLAADALQKYFGYDSSMLYRMRDYYPTQEWMALIRSELNAHRPILYGASNEDGQGGHTFVFDGYDDQDFVHINWGWFGTSNGYFNINALNPYELGIGANGGGYNLHQDMITGIQPKKNDSSVGEFAIYNVARTTVNYWEDLNSITVSGYPINHSPESFRGNILAVLTDNHDAILTTLGSISLTLEGITVNNSSLKIDSKMLSVKNCQTQVPGVKDGNDYRIKLAYQVNSNSPIYLLRQTYGLPDYGIATVSGEKIIAVTQHIPTPKAALLDKIQTIGKVFAKGKAHFTLNIDNQSDKYILKNVSIRATNIEDPTKVFLLKEAINDKNQIYDHSQKVIEINVDLPLEMEAGTYTLKAFEATKKGDFDEIFFDDSKVGESKLVVQAAATEPVLMQIANFGWLGVESREMKVKRGESLFIYQPLRNDGIAGNVQLITRLQQVNNPTTIINFHSIDTSIDGGAKYEAKYINRLDIDPGQYRVLTYYKVNGVEHPIEGTFEECIITVDANEDLPFDVTELTVPEKMVVGQKVTDITLKIKTNKQISGTVYVRIRPTTGTGGELMNMTRATLEPGETASTSFAYRPSTTLTPGAYAVKVSFKGSDGKEVAVGGTSVKNVMIEKDESTGVDPLSLTQVIEMRERTISTLVTDKNANMMICRIDGSKIIEINGLEKGREITLSPGIVILKLYINGVYHTWKLTVK